MPDPRYVSPEKTQRILKYLKRNPVVPSLADIVKATGYSGNTCHRVLINEGYQRVYDEDYGKKVWKLIAS